jgi:hypothetical protein
VIGKGQFEQNRAKPNAFDVIVLSQSIIDLSSNFFLNMGTKKYQQTSYIPKHGGHCLIIADVLCSWACRRRSCLRC